MIAFDAEDARLCLRTIEICPGREGKAAKRCLEREAAEGNPHAIAALKELATEWRNQ